MLFIKRPIFLTIWLVLLTISGISSVYSHTLGSAGITKTLAMSPSLSLMTFVLLGVMVVNLVAVVMLWMWKKLGFYIIVASQIFAAILGMVLGTGGIIVVVFAAISVGILYLAMKPVWQNFK